MLNLMILEPMLLNRKQLHYASEQEPFPGVLGEVVLEHPKNEEPAPHLSFTVMVLYRILRQGKASVSYFLQEQNGA